MPVLAVTGGKDLQVKPGGLQVVAACAQGPVETLLVPDLTHALRRLPGPAFLAAHTGELGSSVDPEVLGTVVDWCARVTHPDGAPRTNT